MWLKLFVIVITTHKKNPSREREEKKNKYDKITCRCEVYFKTGLNDDVHDDAAEKKCRARTASASWGGGATQRVRVGGRS